MSWPAIWALIRPALWSAVAALVGFAASWGTVQAELADVREDVAAVSRELRAARALNVSVAELATEMRNVNARLVRIEVRLDRALDGAIQ